MLMKVIGSVLLKLKSAGKEKMKYYDLENYRSPLDDIKGEALLSVACTIHASLSHT